MLSIYNYRDYSDYDDVFPIPVYEEIEERGISTEEKIKEYFDKKELYDCLKYTFTPYFLWISPKDDALVNVGNDFFEYLDKQFKEKFDIGLFELLGQPFMDLSIHMVKVNVLNFVKFLHRDISQMASPGDIYYTEYADVFRKLGINVVYEIISEFKKIKNLDG